MVAGKLIQEVLDALEGKTQCPSCPNKFLTDSDKYCRGCGNSNYRFNEASFEEDWGRTLFWILKTECGAGHNRFLTETPEAIGRFCEVCGQRLLAN